MANRMIPIYIENKTVNDDVYLIQKICETSGSEVAKGDVVATFETSKSLVDVYAPESGFIYYNDITEGEEVGVGFLLAVISDARGIDRKWFDSYSSNKQVSIQKVDKATGSDTEVRISNAAKKLLLDHKLSIADFKGKKIIRTQDVIDHVNSNAANYTFNHSILSDSIDRIMIIGAGGHARMCLEILQQTSNYEVAGFVDSALQKGTQVHCLQVIGDENELEYLFKTGITHAVIGFSALHKPAIRQRLYDKLINIGISLPNIIHKTAVVEPSVIMGSGNQIMAGAIIGSDVVISDNCILNSGCIVSHDCILSDNVHVAPGAILAGDVVVGKNSLVGMGVTVYMKVRIGENCIIYNGKNVFESLLPGAVVKN